MTSRDYTTFYRRPGFPVLVVLLLMTAYHLATLIHYPVPFPDEPWNGSRTMSLLKNGHTFGSMEEGYRIDVARPWALYSLLPIVLYAIPSYFIGSIDLLALRMVSLGSGLVLLFAMMRIAGLVLGRKAQIAALLVTGFSQPFLFCAHVARPDVMAAALTFLGLSLLLPLNGDDRRRYSLAGFLAGLALSFHLRALLAIPIFAVFLLVFRGPRIFRSLSIYLLALAYAGGVSVYGLIHIFPDPHSFFEAWKLHAASSRIPPAQDGNVWLVWESLASLWSGRSGLKQSGLYLSIAGILYSMALGSRRERRLVAFAVLSFLSGLFIVRNPLLLNLIVFSPLIDLPGIVLVAAAFRCVGKWRSRTDVRSILRLTAAVTAIPLFVFGLYDSSYKPLVSSWDAHLHREVAQDFIDSLLRPGESVMGPQLFWLGQQDRNYYAWEGVLATQRYRNTDLEGAFRHLHPDIFILDDEIRYFLRNDTSTNLWFNDLRLPKSEFAAVMKKYCRLAGRRKFKYYGDVQVYRFHWDDQDHGQELSPSPPE